MRICACVRVCMYYEYGCMSMEVRKYVYIYSPVLDVLALHIYGCYTQAYEH